ncbi:AAA family ATPase [candidate division WOR-3 bacterium]|nr:AAA family ATPase [candidate division WOR-3 bacterium]
MQNLTPFVGRQKELKWLNHHLEKALSYSGGFVLIQGEIGVGKTRLLNQFIDEVRAPGLHILNGRVIKDDVRHFSPFIQMIEDYLCNLEHHRSWFVKFLEPEIIPYFIHLMPKLKNHYPLDMPHLAHPIDNLSFVYSFQRFFENMSKFKPLVLILDDIQWMSGESIELLKFLVRRIINQPILFVATTRLHEDNLVLQQTIDEFNTARQVFTINLTNFSQNETENLVNQKFGINLPNHFVHWLFTITKGNPLFIEEIIKTLIRQNIIYHDLTKNEWLVEEDYEDFPISETVESVINYRLGNLTAPELKLLQGAAVIGERFSLKILRKLFDSMPQKQFLRSNNILVVSGMVEDFGNMKQFSHPLIHALLYQKMKINKRRKLHRKLANILKNIKGSDEEIAFHMTEDLVPAEETRKLVCYLIKISQDLLNKYNYHPAWKYLKIAQRIADKILPLNKQRMKIKSELNHLSWIMGRDVLSFEEAERFVTELVNNDLKKEASIHYRMLFHEALAAQDLKIAEKYLKKALSLVKKNEAFYWTLMVEHCLLQRRKGLLKESEQEAKRLSTEISQVKAPEALYKVFTNLGLVSYLKGDLKEAHRFLSRALKIVEEHHLLLYVGDSYSNLGLVEMTMGKLDSALMKFNNSIKEAELLQREPLIGIDLLYIGYSFLLKGEYERAIKFFEQAEKKAKKTHNPRLQLTAQKGKAKVFLKLDDIEEAESIVKEISENKISKEDYCDLQFIKSIIYLKKGELNLAEEFADKSLKLAKKLHFKPRFANALGTKALVLLHKHQRHEALNCLEKAKTMLLSKGAIPIISDILVNFGLIMGGEQGEGILIEGLKMLFDMRATAKIFSLCKVMKKKGFNNALKFVREKMHVVEVAKIDIFTFGGLSVKKPGELNVVAKKEWQSRKSQELLALILVQSGSRGATREILASYLWPETTEKKSQVNLRVALTHLNKALGNKIILQKGPFLTLNKELTQADLWTFGSLVKEWQNLKQCGKFHPAEDRARRAITLYKGDFLPEFYSQPIVDKQLELEGRIRDLLFWLAMRCMERVEWREAVLFAQRLLILDASDEQACQIIMQGLYNQGDRVGAVRQFERLKKSLKDELNVEPSPETIELYKKIIITD